MRNGYVYAILAAVLFGAAGLFVKMAHSTGLDSVSLLTVQYMLSVTLMFGYGILRDRKAFAVGRKKLLELAVFAVAGNTFMAIFYYMAFEYLPVAMVTILLFTYPVLIFIFTCLFEKGNMMSRKAAAIALAFTGCILALNIGPGQAEYPIIGIILGLLCALFYAFMNIYCEKRLYDVDALVINAYTALFSLIALCIYRFPLFAFKGELKFESIIYIAILAVFSQIVPLTMIYSAIKDIGALKVSIIGNLEIPTAAFLAYIFLGEKLTIIQVLGSALIIIALLLIRREDA
ncbi:MAG: DMT family transporter [Clostridiaceae bacterium]